MFQSQTEISIDTSKNNIFAFWESPNPIPAYLDLCKDTWIKNIPDCQIHILNHSNLHRYIGDVYDLKKLKTISFAMQSDIISAAVLEKFGGLFLDLDCIVIDDVFDMFNKISDSKLISFGRPVDKAIHLAVLYCGKPNNPLLREWRKAAQYRLENKPEEYPWHYFGNGIINPLFKNPEYGDDFYIIDRTISGNILESAALIDSDLSRVIPDYQNFYFNEYFRLNPSVLDCVTCGVISLHNSWTPKKYKEISSKEEFLSSDAPIAGLIGYILNNDTRKEYSNTFPILELFLVKNLNSNKIDFNLKYFRNMMVLDFSIMGIDFAFDISIKDDYIYLDFVSRNTPYSEIQNIPYFKTKDFNANKAFIISGMDAHGILSEILQICSMIEKFGVRKSLSDKETVVDLKTFRLVEKVLYIEGIGILIGQNAQEYGDIDYELVLRGGSGDYIKKLAKAHHPELTELYAVDGDISYDKCWFATYQYKGVDLSDILNGGYDLFIRITVKGQQKQVPLVSRKPIKAADHSFQFESNNSMSRLTILK